MISQLRKLYMLHGQVGVTVTLIRSPPVTMTSQYKIVHQTIETPLFGGISVL
jgi:hypothetical protein